MTESERENLEELLGQVFPDPPACEAPDYLVGVVSTAPPSSDPTETYQPAAEPAPELIARPKLRTEEELAAARAARNVQQVISREEARLTFRARRAMLQALHEAAGAGLEAMDRSELENAQRQIAAKAKVAEIQEAHRKKTGILWNGSATVNAPPPAPLTEEEL